MNIAVSQFAWNREEEDTVFEFLQEQQVDSVEVIFSKIKPWSEIQEEDVWSYKRKLASYGLTSVSAQSLFYGINCAITDTACVLAHLERLIRYSQILGVQTLVFGSAKMRAGVPEDTNVTLQEIDRRLLGTGIQFLIEPNARFYGGNYWFTVAEIDQFLADRFVNVKTMLDIHNVLLENREEITDFFDYAHKIQHVHVSEFNLELLKDPCRHEQFANTLRTHSYNKTVTYEVLRNDVLRDMLESIRNFTRIYGNANL